VARNIVVQRVYDSPLGGPKEYRVLVDRLWPRGVKKDELHMDEWAKDVAPSPELRRWYGHDPSRFDEFRRRYLKELSSSAAGHLKAYAGTLVLLTATRDVEHSGAAVLAEHLRRG
jgi:uncharacterized protein YeaO (DUF488 family)